MYTYKLLIAYDGKEFVGWQIQPKGRSIQGEIEQALHVLTKTNIRVIGSGRTDAQVNAVGQVAHFKSQILIDVVELRYRINSILPRSIRIKDIALVDESFHACYSAIKKEYHYHLWCDRVDDPFVARFRYHILLPFSPTLAQEAINQLIGTHDFSSFTNHGTVVKDHVRTLYRISLIPQVGGYRIEFEGDGFLYKMVRNMVGVIVAIATSKAELSLIKSLFEKKDRRLCPAPAPGYALFLHEVFF